MAAARAAAERGLHGLGLRHGGRQPDRLRDGNHFKSTHPDSVFRHWIFASAATPAERVNLMNRDVTWAAGETETGMTVHWVSGKVDSGGIIAQFRTPISPDDTPDDIAAKEHALEMEHFPQVIEALADNVLIIN